MKNKFEYYNYNSNRENEQKKSDSMDNLNQKSNQRIDSNSKEIKLPEGVSDVFGDFSPEEKLEIDRLDKEVGAAREQYARLFNFYLTFKGTSEDFDSIEELKKAKQEVKKAKKRYSDFLINKKIEETIDTNHTKFKTEEKNIDRYNRHKGFSISFDNNFQENSNYNIPETLREYSIDNKEKQVSDKSNNEKASSETPENDNSVDNIKSESNDSKDGNNINKGYSYEGSTVSFDNNFQENSNYNIPETLREYSIDNKEKQVSDKSNNEKASSETPENDNSVDNSNENNKESNDKEKQVDDKFDNSQEAVDEHGRLVDQLKEAREAYAKMDISFKESVRKLGDLASGLFGGEGFGASEELKVVKKDYENAQKKLLDFLIDRRFKGEVPDMKYLEVTIKSVKTSEFAKMDIARQKAKNERFGGFGEKIEKVKQVADNMLDKYRKMPFKKRMIFLGAGLGLTAVSAGIGAAGVAGGVAVGTRALGFGSLYKGFRRKDEIKEKQNLEIESDEKRIMDEIIDNSEQIENEEEKKKKRTELLREALKKEIDKTHEIMRKRDMEHLSDGTKATIKSVGTMLATSYILSEIMSELNKDDMSSSGGNNIPNSEINTTSSGGSRIPNLETNATSGSSGGNNIPNSEINTTSSGGSRIPNLETNATSGNGGGDSLKSEDNSKDVDSKWWKEFADERWDVTVDKLPDSLIIPKGSSVEEELIKFLKEHSDSVKFNGEGFQDGNDLNKWAEKIAHKMALEYTGADNIKAIDLVYPGAEVNLDIDKDGNIKIAKVEVPKSS